MMPRTVYVTDRICHGPYMSRNIYITDRICHRTYMSWAGPYMPRTPYSVKECAIFGIYDPTVLYYNKFCNKQMPQAFLYLRRLSGFKRDKVFLSGLYNLYRTILKCNTWLLTYMYYGYIVRLC